MRRFIAPLVMVGLLVSCGSDDADVVETQAPMTEAPTSEAPTSEAPTSEAPTSEAPTDEMQDIVTIASGTEDFSTLVAAVSAAGLVETLQGEGPFTVFAPTNAAFAALPAGLVDKLLLPENKELLVKILTYHVVAGKIMVADVVAGEVASVEGQNIIITTEGGAKVNEANIIEVDIEASNGVIHVIDAVILPPDVDVAAL